MLHRASYRCIVSSVADSQCCLRNDDLTMRTTRKTRDNRTLDMPRVFSASSRRIDDFIILGSRVCRVRIRYCDTMITVKRIELRYSWIVVRENRHLGMKPRAMTRRMRISSARWKIRVKISRGSLSYPRASLLQRYHRYVSTSIDEHESNYLCETFADAA